MSDFVLILSLLYCWIFGGSALVLGCASEKNKSVKLVSREGEYIYFKKIVLQQRKNIHPNFIMGYQIYLGILSRTLQYVPRVLVPAPG